MDSSPTEPDATAEPYRPRADLLAGRVILVTGAGAGIGAAVAKACGAHGATVVLLGRTLSKLEAIYDQIEAADGPQPAIYPLDLAGAGPHEYEALAATLRESVGRLDGLVHNAAMNTHLGPLGDVNVEDWYRVLQVNLNAPFLLTQSCLPLLQQAPDASIVFTLDELARRGRAYWGAYGVSKVGAEGLMRILADELENTSKIRVNAVVPCPVRTNLRARAFPAENSDHLPQPEAITGTYLRLLGEDGRGVNGEVVPAGVGA